jgi:serine/threonine-protein kinase
MRYIGKYKIQGLLGRGGMGKIYKVEHPIIGKVAALKLLDPDPLLIDLMGLDSIRSMFKTEAITMARLRHPNIVEILDYSETDTKPYYLMDYYVNNLGVMIGESSHAELPSRKIKVEKALYYTRQTLQGLACLHHAGVIHRDIKPYNLLVTDQDTIKICDFGLSKLRGEKFVGPPSLKVGSAWYAPPEQEEDPDSVDFSADLYAVGITLYRMLTGVLPEDNLSPVNRFNVDLDKSWDDFIHKALAARSQDRYASAKLMLADLEILQQSWEEKKAKICRLPEPTAPKPQHESDAQDRQPRKHCIKVDPRAARKVFAIDDLWRPARYVRNEFTIHSNATITDRTTGLVWQRFGSEFPMTWHQARQYVEQLNETHFAECRDWRLPTIDELMTLLTEVPQGEDYCIEPIFDQTQKWLWSCDRRSFTAAWYVSCDMGYVAWQDFSGYYYVRAVRSRENA